jgi:hypothetical protein
MGGRMKKIIILLISHALVAFGGFALGIYLLPILTAPAPPMADEMNRAVSNALYEGEFRRDLQDSDFLHWGEGKIMIGRKSISLQGRLAPGPDYKLYLSPEFLETEADFHQLKSSMVKVGDVKTFENFIVSVPPHIDPEKFHAVIVWCESFEQFITAARYR